ncbi:MAG: alpha/beta fold hydrolase [Dehalococcoidia bacterium]
MHYVVAGVGETVLMLHGFPESWYSWRHQIAALASYYRVIAPDLRGYNETESQGPYDTDTIQADVLSLLDHAGVERAHVVAHDWGGAIAWLLAIGHPERVQSLTVCNIPHPALFQRGLRRNPRQMLRSWYIAFFQIPWLPERVLAAHRYHTLARMLINDCRPGTFTREDLGHMLASWRRSGLGGGIGWYRALLRHPRRLPRPVPTVTAPTLMIWGEDDSALGRDLTDGTEQYVEKFELKLLPNTSHWVQQEEPRAVSEMILEHIRKAPLHA